MALGSSPMPDPAPGGGPFGKLNPKQRRVAIALAVAGILALIVLLSRRRQPVDTTATDQAAADQAAAAQLAGYGVPPQSTFADNGAASAQLSQAVTDALGDITKRLTTINRRIGPGLAGKVGKIKALEQKIRAEEAKILKLEQQRKKGGKKQGKKQQHQ